MQEMTGVEVAFVWLLEQPRMLIAARATEESVTRAVAGRGQCKVIENMIEILGSQNRFRVSMLKYKPRAHERSTVKFLRQSVNLQILRPRPLRQKHVAIQQSLLAARNWT